MTIHPRSTWAVHVAAADRPQAAGRPVKSSGRWEPWLGGVLLHHRGVGSFSPDSEEDCEKDVAQVFAEDINDVYDDISYNYFVCPHGNVYEGRGHERGEANGGDHIRVDGVEVGNNTGFYSICALHRSWDEPSEPMLRSIRDLIAHLRDDAPMQAGSLILPHASGWKTDCPGTLTPYATNGSPVDPSVAWEDGVLMDMNVFGAQKWVNDRYDELAPGYLKCLTTGRTGWPTVLSLTQALQYELGIRPTVQNFGPGTMQAVQNHPLRPDTETNPDIISIYNWALWCKGYAAGRLSHVWDEASRNSFTQLLGHMGLTGVVITNALWARISRALLTMDQFRVVPGGDAVTQSIQQHINKRYVAQRNIPAMNLVPCDGHYSREVQKGLMMALQYELGIGVNDINGYFGPGTESGLRTRGSGALTGDFRLLFRSACFLNSPTYGDGQQIPYSPQDIHTDAQTATHTNWLRAFQSFSQIPVTGTNDYTTWAQLLISAGDSRREATGCDCITEITLDRGRQLKTEGYQIVGRYLDEHLSPGDPYYLGKALKPGELQNIFAAGLRMFPIFQYNGTQLANFTYDKGYDQGTKADEKARGFGLPQGSCIYFAVDYDAMDADIDSSVLPYFHGVRTALQALGHRYEFGVYGSRNVCIRVSREAGARWSFVSGMSWGFSGNLGYPLPANWSFNQIHEYEFRPGWGLDRNVWRQGGDPGVSSAGSP
ncbi:glycoside hydrolase domain-containing protein [Streptosporangium sp. NPDC002524]|uniref:glycoside hydrolase domain-containing protein n=1 Tax=Streptosporangium sp. NPDC002524 TaxID=3154537 RepID=UPI00332B7B42